MESIGFIGLGKMGGAIAGNLLKVGFQLHVYNRTAEKAAALVAQGARLTLQPSDTAERGGIVISMLANDQALAAVVDGGFLERFGPDGIHLSMSTISPRLARHLAEQHRRYEAEYVAAPVFGRPESAAAQKLWICISSPAEAKEQVRPTLNVIGQGTFDFGDEPAAAHVVKLGGGTFCWPPPLRHLPRRLYWEKKTGLIEAAWRTCWAVPYLPALSTRPTAALSRSSGLNLQVSPWSWG